MSTMSTKRPGGDFPDTRPTKRHISSEPEEGELDDTPPPTSAVSRGETPLPASSASKLPSKVPFPFKKKPQPSNGHAEPPNDLRLRLSDNRNGDEDRRQREDDLRRAGNGRVAHADDRQNRLGDHWVSDHDSRPRLPRRETYDGRYDDRSYRPYSEVNNWEPRRAHTLVSPRPARRTRSPSSPRSRSPSSAGSPGREKHRLPRPSVADVASRVPYESDRGRDERDRDYKRGRWRANSPSSSLNDDDKYHKSRDTWSRRDRSSDSSRRNDTWSSSRRDGDHHVTTSPRTPPRPLSPQSLPDGPRTPAPPLLESLPSRPRGDDRPTYLPSTHTTVKISLPRKPPTPKEKSPPVSLVTGRDSRRPEPDSTRSRPESATVKVHKSSRRKPVQRTRDEERAAYGRAFQGCGQQSDYEVINKLGEGTFGEVHKAFHKDTRQAVALKRILMHNEKEGMPVTALREIKILKSLNHPCIVDILDMFVVRSRGKESPLSVYMVFPYMDHDLAGLLENERVKLLPSQIKLYMKQLLEGTEYMHRNHILHRDMKAANLLISNTGSLMIADFGLARAFDPNLVKGGEYKDGILVPKERKYTNCVVTRWYRPPELLLGARQYGGEVDMWGIGCVLGEMFVRKPILPGSSDLDQLEKIWQLCGTPTQVTWPNFDMLPGCEGVKRFTMYARKVKQQYETIGQETCDLLERLLTCNPRDRITASQALDHDYFWTDPLPADPRTLPTYEASHEFDKRGRRQQAHAPPAIPHRPDPPSRPVPAPTQPPPLYFGRQPPRDSLRNAPPPLPLHHHAPNQPPSRTSHGKPNHSSLPRPPLPPAPLVSSAPTLPLAPQTLPPLVYRPGAAVPALYTTGDRPPGLPPRPLIPMGRGERERPKLPFAREESGGGLNYG